MIDSFRNGPCQRRSLRVAMQLALVFVAVPASAASWFVDNTAIGANSGASWGDAWTGFDQVVWGTGGVQSGDTLFISGGTDSRTYVAAQTGLLTLGAPGVTIRVGQDPGHDGTVILDGAGTWEKLIVLSASSVVDGTAQGERRLFLQNGPPNGSSAAVVAEFGPTVPTDGVKVRGIIVDGFASGIRLGSASQEVSNCVVRNIYSGVAIEAGNVSAEQGWNRINDCEVYPLTSSDQGAIGIIPGPSTDVFDNHIEATTGLIRGNQKSSGIWIEYTYQQKSIRIFRNTLRNFPNTGIQACGMSRLDVFNNVFRQDRQTRVPSTPIVICGYMLGFLDHLRIANNTIVDFFDGHAISIETSGSEAYEDWEIRNNLIFNSGNATTPAIATRSFAAEANVFIDSNLVNAGTRGSSAVVVNGAEWTQPNGSTDAPAFMSYAERSPDNDFHLHPSDTAAHDRGADLGVDFVDDFDKVPRPVGKAWDIGAFEYTGESAPDAGTDPDGGTGGTTWRELQVGGCNCGPGSASVSLVSMLTLAGLLVRRRR